MILRNSHYTHLTISRSIAFNALGRFKVNTPLLFTSSNRTVSIAPDIDLLKLWLEIPFLINDVGFANVVSARTDAD